MPDDPNTDTNVTKDPADPPPSEPMDNKAADPPADPAASPGTANPPADPAASPGTATPPADPATTPGTANPPADPAATPGTANPPADPAATPGTANPPADPAAKKTADEDTKQTDGANGNGNGQDDQSRHRSPESEKIFTWLTVGQYVVLGAIGVIIVLYLFGGLFGNNNAFLFALAKPEVARGVITFLVAAGTVSLAVLLVMAAIMSSGSKDLGNRFAFGKEVLTLLIGILGTIVGFYYGSAKEEVVSLALSPVALSEPAPKIGDKFTLDAVVIGGTSPYVYSIKFNRPEIIPDVIDQGSAGPIHHEFTIPTDKGAKAGDVITFTIDVKDAKEQTFTYNKDGKQSITLQAGDATPSPPNTATPTGGTPQR